MPEGKGSDACASINVPCIYQGNYCINFNHIGTCVT